MTRVSLNTQTPGYAQWIAVSTTSPASAPTRRLLADPNGIDISEGEEPVVRAECAAITDTARRVCGDTTIGNPLIVNHAANHAEPRGDLTISELLRMAVERGVEVSIVVTPRPQ